MIFALVAKTPPLNVLLHGSHASPRPSPSTSACPGLATVGQLSCASQVPSPSLSAEPVSAGQLSLEPVQVSATSQTPAAERHTVLADFFTSLGQRSVAPLQTSATSQTPAAA